MRITVFFTVYTVLYTGRYRYGYIFVAGKATPEHLRVLKFEAKLAELFKQPRAQGIHEHLNYIPIYKLTVWFFESQFQLRIFFWSDSSVCFWFLKYSMFGFLAIQRLWQLKPRPHMYWDRRWRSASTPSTRIVPGAWSRRNLPGRGSG